MERCENCPLWDRPYIEGEGYSDCRILVVGTAPGAAEEKANRIFSGSSGRFLRDLLSDLGLEERVYLTNVLKRRPVTDEGCGRRPNKEECWKCGSHLASEIVRSQPRLVMTLGILPLRYFSHYSLRRVQGLPIPTKKFQMDIKVIPTYDPSYVLRRGGPLSETGDKFISALEDLREEANRKGI